MEPPAGTLHTHLAEQMALLPETFSGSSERAPQRAGQRALIAPESPLAPQSVLVLHILPADSPLARLLTRLLALIPAHIEILIAQRIDSRLISMG